MRPRPTLLLPLLLAACEEPQSMLRTGGAAAEAIEGLWWVMMTGAIAIVLLVAALVFIGGWRGRPERGTTRIIYWGGFALPIAALSGLLLYSTGVGRVIELLAPGNTPVWSICFAGSSSTAAAALPTDEPLRIEVVGNQWWWEVRYPDAGPQAVLANEIHIPVGQPVEVVVSSDDVIHSLWIPGLAGKVDMVPGRSAQLFLLAEEAGVFRGQCAEFCGAQHARMALWLVAEPPGEFRRWLAHQTLPAGQPETELALAGREAFFAAGCPACHTVRGTPADGEVGPDLTHVGGRLTIGAGILSNNIGTIAGWIADSQDIKPGNRMPSFDRLESTELRAIAAWLEGLE